MPLIQTSVEEFAEYHKIETLYERDERFVVNPNHLKKPVLGTISHWRVAEKINGINIRVMLSTDGTVRFGGRTNNAMIPADLVQYLVRAFPPDLLRQTFWRDNAPTQAILFAEGYGPGIQKGGAYRNDKSSILFDVLVGGRWWLDFDDVRDVAGKLNIETVPDLGIMTLDEIVELVRVPFPSRIGTAMAEGIVARPIETLFDKRGERIIIKLKTRDFQPGKR